MLKLKYVDSRPIYIPYLTMYGGGIALPSGNNEISVTEGEAKNLLKITNGSKQSFEEIKERTKKPEILEDMEA